MCRENDVRLNTDSMKWHSTLYSFGNFNVQQYDDSINWHSTIWRFGKTTIRWNDVSGKWYGARKCYKSNLLLNAAARQSGHWSYLAQQRKSQGFSSLNSLYPYTSIATSIYIYANMKTGWPYPFLRHYVMRWFSRESRDVNSSRYRRLMGREPRRLNVPCALLMTWLCILSTNVIRFTKYIILKAFQSINQLIKIFTLFIIIIIFYKYLLLHVECFLFIFNNFELTILIMRELKFRKGFL